MRMMIRYQNGLRVEAVLLAANSERMRVAIGSQCDTIELHRVDAGWCTQRGAAIDIEALMAIPGTDLPGFCAEMRRN
jgi:RNA polymerase-binding transcription factor DksA